MAITGIGSAFTATQYDFTSMTSKQASDAAKDLFSQGKFTAEAAGRLEGAASGIDYTPVDRSQAGKSTDHTLADSSKVDWVSYMQTSSNWMHANAGTIGLESTDTLLTELSSYQESAGETAKTISTQA